GWHWSPSAGCWQRKITESAKKSAEMIYKGEAVEERKVVAAMDKTEKERVKQDKKREAPPVSAGLFAGIHTKSDRKVEEVISPVKGEMRTAVKTEPEKEEIKPAPVKEPKTEFKKATRADLKKELKIAAKRELKREIIVKAKPEMKAEAKPAEKPKAIDWSKIAAQVASRQEPKTETVADVKETGEAQEEAAKSSYSYEAYSD
ncbi:MAG TPA: hypothetical protein VJ647_04275, partial [Chitinophagaceae bacterium]|nr:hypothetical protein [Chitinophagaceae bacterium]